MADLAPAAPPGPYARQVVDAALQRLAGAGSSSSVAQLLAVGRRIPGEAGQPL